MTVNRNDQYRIPAAPATPGEVIKTYDLSGTLTAEDALRAALEAAHDAPRELDPNDLDTRRSERFGAAAMVTIEPTQPSVEKYDPQNLAHLKQAGEAVVKMRDLERAA